MKFESVDEVVSLVAADLSAGRVSPETIFGGQRDRAVFYLDQYKKLLKQPEIVRELRDPANVNLFLTAARLYSGILVGSPPASSEPGPDVDGLLSLYRRLKGEHGAEQAALPVGAPG
jgi:hypothetical protein